MGDIDGSADDIGDVNDIAAVRQYITEKPMKTLLENFRIGLLDRITPLLQKQKKNRKRKNSVPLIFGILGTKASFFARRVVAKGDTLSLVLVSDSSFD